MKRVNIFLIHLLFISAFCLWFVISMKCYDNLGCLHQMTEECAETVEECQSGTKGCVNGKLNFPNDLIKIYKTCLPESIECKPAGCYKENFTKFCVKKENATADLRKPVDTEFVEFCYCDSDLCNGQVSSTTKGNKGSKCVVSWIIFSFVVFVDVLELFIR